jgi:phage tail-like protein
MSERGLVRGLGVRQPIGLALPAMYHDDPFVQRFCEALDEVIAPVPSTIDNFWAYLDPWLCPEDFVDWLAGWLGILPDQTWDTANRRSLIGLAAALVRDFGTVSSLASLIELYTGHRPEIVEGGGVAWSETPDGELPGAPNNQFAVRLEVDDPSTVDAARLDRMVAANKPAHLAHVVEVVRATKKGAAVPPPPPPPPPPPSPSGDAE